MNVVLVKVVGVLWETLYKYKPNIKYSDDTFHKTGYSSQRFAYLHLILVSLLLLHTGSMGHLPFTELCGLCG